MLWKVWFTIDNVLCSVVVLFVTMWCLPLRRRCLPLGRRGCRTLSVDCVHTSSKQTYPSSHTSPTSTYSSFTSCLIDGGCFQFAPFLLGFPVICGFKIYFWSCVFDMLARLSPKRKWPNSSMLQPFWLFWPTPLLSWCYIPPPLCAPFEMGNQCAQIIFVIQRLPGSSTQPAARNKLMVLSPALQNSILPVAAPAKSFAFAHPFTHYTFCASITSGGGDLV